MGRLIAVFGDQNTHGGGELLASNNTGKIYINDKKVVYRLSEAMPDPIHPPAETKAASGSLLVFGEGEAIHRAGDNRFCGATTIVTGQSKVYAGG